MRDMVLAAGLLCAGAPALALQAGAPLAQPTQPGAWGPQGWQPGAAPAPAPAYAPASAYAPAPAYPPAPPPGFAGAPHPMAQPYAPAPADRIYDRIEPGRRVKGAAAAPANTVLDPAAWGLPRPPATMRWIRYYDDAVLLDARDRAVDVRSVPWDLPAPPPPVPPVVAARPAYAPPLGAETRAPGTYTAHHGGTTVVTQVLPPPALVGAAYGPYGQVVGVTPGTITTTTRTYWVRGGGPSPHRRAHRR